ncbi:hypothetical protein AO9_04230 [Chlamydia psittaci Mat116]|nr:hypothetical protein AO9_04230 [Chlamydia psittaci Mat116]
MELVVTSRETDKKSLLKKINVKQEVFLLLFTLAERA